MNDIHTIWPCGCTCNHSIAVERQALTQCTKHSGDACKIAKLTLLNAELVKVLKELWLTMPNGINPLAGLVRDMLVKNRVNVDFHEGNGNGK